jgi:predicted GIY-YIG superfamily endonuclease
MFYVYLLQSLKRPQEHYVGFTEDLKERVKDHNSGKSIHTNKFKPWELIAYFSLSGIQTAKKF